MPERPGRPTQKETGAWVFQIAQASQSPEGIRSALNSRPYTASATAPDKTRPKSDRRHEIGGAGSLKSMDLARNPSANNVRRAISTVKMGRRKTKKINELAPAPTAGPNAHANARALFGGSRKVVTK